MGIIDGFCHQSVAFGCSEIMLWIFLMTRNPDEAKPCSKIVLIHMGLQASHNCYLKCLWNQSERRDQRLRLHAMLFHISTKWKRILFEGRGCILTFQVYFQKVKSPQLNTKSISNAVITALRLFKNMLLKMHLCMKHGSVSRKDVWMSFWQLQWLGNSMCKVKQIWARQFRKFYKLFSSCKKVLRCKLPFLWLDKHGSTSRGSITLDTWSKL